MAEINAIIDLSESEPEAYGEIRSQDKLSKRVKKIRIRDVVNATLNDPKRLNDMLVFQALTIVERRSQFDSWALRLPRDFLGQMRS